MKLLARHGVGEYWLVDPQAVTIEVYSLITNQFALVSTAAGNEPLHSSLLPGLSLIPTDLAPA